MLLKIKKGSERTGNIIIYWLSQVKNKNYQHLLPVRSGGILQHLISLVRSHSFYPKRSLPLRPFPAAHTFLFLKKCMNFPSALGCPARTPGWLLTLSLRASLKWDSAVSLVHSESTLEAVSVCPSILWMIWITWGWHHLIPVLCTHTSNLS